MKFLRILIIAVFALLLSAELKAQSFLWQAEMDFRFDNREYDGMRTGVSETIFGTHFIPMVGLGWGKNNDRNILAAGADMLANFGKGNFMDAPDLIFYYRFANRNFKIYAGVFPRKHTLGNYSGAFFSDSLLFYDKTVEGALLQYAGRKGYVELGFDWNGMYGEERREKFMLFSSGRINHRMFFAGYSASVYHHAGSVAAPGVVDNILVYPYLGIDLARITNFQKFYLSAGWLQAFQHDRKYIGEYVRPGGAQVEFAIQRWGVGINNTLYLGDNLMPYYTSTTPDQPVYGSGLYNGETFYRTDSGIYNRLEVYWQSAVTNSVNFKISSVHHYDGYKWGWQQVASLSVIVGNNMFRKKR